MSLDLEEALRDYLSIGRAMGLRGVIGAVRRGIDSLGPGKLSTEPIRRSDCQSVDLFTPSYP